MGVVCITPRVFLASPNVNDFRFKCFGVVHDEKFVEFVFGRCDECG